MSKWIEINTETPDSGACVDLYVDWQDCTGRVCNCFRDGDNYWRWDESVRFKMQIQRSMITHWMSLPEPPEQK